MSPEEEVRTRTYEDRYRSLGLLFYSIAGCDRKIIQKEIEALKKIVEEHWLVEDRNYDDLGIESARYIDIAFDQAHEGRVSPLSAYQQFEKAQMAEPHRYDNWTKSLILRTAVHIAQASGSVNSAEANRIGELQKLLGRSVS